MGTIYHQIAESWEKWENARIMVSSKSGKNQFVWVDISPYVVWENGVEVSRVREEESTLKFSVIPAEGRDTIFENGDWLVAANVKSSGGLWLGWVGRVESVKRVLRWAGPDLEQNVKGVGFSSLRLLRNV